MPLPLSIQKELDRAKEQYPEDEFSLWCAAVVIGNMLSIGPHATELFMKKLYEELN